LANPRGLSRGMQNHQALLLRPIEWHATLRNYHLFDGFFNMKLCMMPQVVLFVQLDYDYNSFDLDDEVLAETHQFSPWILKFQSVQLSRVFLLLKSNPTHFFVCVHHNHSTDLPTSITCSFDKSTRKFLPPPPLTRAARLSTVLSTSLNPIVLQSRPLS